MLISEETSATERSAQEVWDLWSDPARWSEWDPDITSVDFDGDFTPGASGSLKPPSGPKVKWTIESVNHPTSFVTTSKLPGSTVRFEHELVTSNDSLQVTHRVVMNGWSAPLLGRIIGPKLTPSPNRAVRNVAGAAT